MDICEAFDNIPNKSILYLLIRYIIKRKKPSKTGISRKLWYLPLSNL